MTTTVGIHEAENTNIKMTGQTIMYRTMYPKRGESDMVPGDAGESPSENFSMLVLGLSLGLAFATVGAVFTMALQT